MTDQEPPKFTGYGDGAWNLSSLKPAEPPEPSPESIARQERIKQAVKATFMAILFPSFVSLGPENSGDSDPSGKYAASFEELKHPFDEENADRVIKAILLEGGIGLIATILMEVYAEISEQLGAGMSEGEQINSLLVSVAILRTLLPNIIINQQKIWTRLSQPVDAVRDYLKRDAKAISKNDPSQINFGPSSPYDVSQFPEHP